MCEWPLMRKQSGGSGGKRSGACPAQALPGTWSLEQRSPPCAWLLSHRGQPLAHAGGLAYSARATTFLELPPRSGGTARDRSPEALMRSRPGQGHAAALVDSGGGGRGSGSRGRRPSLQCELEGLDSNPGPAACLPWEIPFTSMSSVKL